MTTDNDLHEELMREAIRLSAASIQSGGGPFGAIVVRDGVVIGRGQNRVTAKCDPTAHAEIMAIRDACDRLQTFSLAGCEIYASCEPCPMCLGAILWSRIDRITHAATRHDAAAAGFDDSRFHGEVTSTGEQRSLPMTSLLRDEAAAVLIAWKWKVDRVHY